ncbi:MAG: STAS domain-containing protein [Bacteroidetes bacterium]|nr:STAS domain-containing protein [Bacteroidota bacterium]
MEEKLDITREERDEYSLLKIDGRIDGSWSKHLDEYLDEMLNAGTYNVALDLGSVHYMSSMGIRVIMKYAKLYRQVNGGFGILSASKNVDDILEMAGLKTILQWQAKAAEAPAEEVTKTVESAGVSYTISSLPGSQPMQCRFTGDPAKIRNGGFTGDDCINLESGRKHYGIGLGAIGLDFEDCKNRFGEFIALGDAVACCPAGNAKSPDYMLKTGRLIPAVRLLYGVSFKGDFDKTVRFSPDRQNEPVRFSRLITELIRITGYERFAMVMLAETSGLVGLSINTPVAAGENRPLNPFMFPEVRENVNFTTGPEYKKMMTITVGIVSGAGDDFREFTRPLSPGSAVWQHFHTAVFSYHAFKKTNIDPDETISTLFEQEELLDVLHLINDTREFTGAGESDFKNGVCWIGHIQS